MLHQGNENLETGLENKITCVMEQRNNASIVRVVYDMPTYET